MTALNYVITPHLVLLMYIVHVLHKEICNGCIKRRCVINYVYKNNIHVRCLSEKKITTSVVLRKKTLMYSDVIECMKTANGRLRMFSWRQHMFSDNTQQSRRFQSNHVVHKLYQVPITSYICAMSDLAFDCYLEYLACR